MATILLTGDVMLGRGIDQILPHPCEPRLYEPFVKSALTYVSLAEARNGPIPRAVGSDYIWGDALESFRRADVRIVNLETALTCCDEAGPKGINYRCHPANVPCLQAASIDCCVLANNHVLDWGEQGMVETLTALESAGIAHAGAGRSLNEARAPAILALPDGRRVLVYAMAAESSGVPRSWAAGPDRPGVHLFANPDAAIDRLAAVISDDRRHGDIAIASIHWGPNWGYDVPQGDRRFAHRLIDEVGIDIVHGHSSHHPKSIELYRGKPILYGCGDFLNDYEGISGHESYRPEIVLAYSVTVAAGEFDLALMPFRISHFCLGRACQEETEWLAATLDRQCRCFGSQVTIGELGSLLVAPS